MQVLAIDLGKQSFHIHGITNDGEVISKKVSRSKLEATVQGLSPESIAMEACASAHHWGRRFEAVGSMVTTTPNELTRETHPDRMPMILDSDVYETWLTGTLDEAFALIKPFPADRMVIHQSGEGLKSDPAGLDVPG